MKEKLSLLSVLMFFSVLVSGQSSFWSPIQGRQALLMDAEKIYEPEVAKTYSLDFVGLRKALNDCPLESASKGKIVKLPMADGRVMAFELFESPVMQPALAAKYPSIKTFSGRLVSDSRVSGRFSYGVDGFHGYILGLGSPVIIDPIYHKNDKLHQVFFRKDLHDRESPASAFICDVEMDYPSVELATVETSSVNREVLGAEVQLRTYRLAMATTGEYSDKFGGNITSVMAEVVNVVNRLNSITERDFAIRFELIDGTDALFYFDENTDPYTNGNTSAMINENKVTIAGLIPFNNYDIGHVLGTNGGGLAQLRSICGANKARGVTSAGGHNGDQFYVDFVAHEVGHQLGSNHTFNNCSGFASGNENTGTAYEPGSGSTIMSYSGICGANNILFDSDPYYHTSSLFEITNYMIKGAGNNCAQKTNKGNHYPTASISLENGFFIPIGTPFKLDGVGEDEDGDMMTYSWEQFDLGPLSDIGSPIGNAPIFRAMPPNDKTYRIFPKLATIFSGVVDDKEIIPAYSRDLTFMFTVRDNHPGGGAAAWKQVAFEATAAAGPFIVTLPGLADKIWEVGEYALVEWNVANTDVAPVNCKLVNIRLIKGLDYENSILLAQNVENIGSAYVLVPDLVANNYHVIVEAADNVFFDASSSSHKIQSVGSPRLSAGLSVTGVRMCVPTTEQVVVNTIGLGGYAGDASFELLGDLPAGANVYFESTTVSAGESTNLVLDFNDVLDFVPIELQIVVKGTGVDSIVMDLHLDVMDFNFTSLEGTSPVNGASGVGIFPELTWLQLPSANTFDVQVATSPTFDAESIVQERFGAAVASFSLTEELAVSTLYYWRIRAHNECGGGDWAVPSSFSTVNLSCNAISATDMPLLISGNNPGTSTSVVHISSTGMVNDLNVNHLKGKHSYLGEISVKLTAPSGESAVLMANKCSNTSAPFDLSFDDESLLTSPCGLSGKVKPAQSFSVFEGVGVAGDWKLSVTDNTVGSGGNITAWSLELCSDMAFNAPNLVKNEIMHINSGWSKILDDSFLLAEDVDNEPEELLFTLVLAPKHGDLTYFGAAMPVGFEFSQAVITEGGIRYQNDGSSAMEDEFYFSVADGQGGYIPVTKYSINMIPVGTNELVSQDFDIYPNPIKDVVNISFGDKMAGDVEISLIDVLGRVLKHYTLKDAANTQISVRDMTTGTYFVHILNQGQVGVKKVVIGK